MLIVTLPLAALAYVIVTTFLFGDPMQPIALATVWSDRLGLPHWRPIAILCAALSTLTFARPFRGIVTATLRLPVFASLAVLLPTAILGLCADGIRHRAVLALDADEVEDHPFFASIRNAPAEHQLFLHAAALKNCVAYAWSYRTLAFHELPADIGANVLPQAWISRCGITRTDRR